MGWSLRGCWRSHTSSTAAEKGLIRSHLTHHLQLNQTQLLHRLHLQHAANTQPRTPRPLFGHRRVPTVTRRGLAGGKQHQRRAGKRNSVLYRNR